MMFHFNLHHITLILIGYLSNISCSPLPFGLLLAHLSRRLKVSYCDRFLSGVRRPSSVVRKLFTFSSSSPKCMVRFQPNCVGIILRGKRSKVAKMVHVAPRGAQGEGPKGKNYVNFKHLLLQIGK